MALTDSLISYWDLSEASGTRVDSVVASANDLTDNNTVTGDTGPGAHNASVFVRANTEYLDHADNASLSVDGTSFSITAWIYHSGDAGGDDNFILGKCVGGDKEYRLNLRASSTIVFDVFLSAENRADSGVTPSSATWYFVAAWFDTAGNTVNISVNDGTPASTGTSGSISATTAAFGIGGTSNEPGNKWDGRQALVGFWKRVLTSGEITQLYNSGNGLSFAELGGTMVGRGHLDSLKLARKQRWI